MKNTIWYKIKPAHIYNVFELFVCLLGVCVFGYSTLLFIKLKHWELLASVLLDVTTIFCFLLLSIWLARRVSINFEKNRDKTVKAISNFVPENYGDITTLIAKDWLEIRDKLRPIAWNMLCYIYKNPGHSMSLWELEAGFTNVSKAHCYSITRMLARDNLISVLPAKRLAGNMYRPMLLAVPYDQFCIRLKLFTDDDDNNQVEEAEAEIPTALATFDDVLSTKSFDHLYETRYAPYYEPVMLMSDESTNYSVAFRIKNPTTSSWVLYPNGQIFVSNVLYHENIIFIWRFLQKDEQAKLETKPWMEALNIKLP